VAAVDTPAIEGGTPVRDTFLPFSTPAIGQEEIDEVVDTLRSGWLTTGPKAQRFEEDFAGFADARHAIAVSSCTAALHLSLLAAGCGPGDEVIAPDLTFVSTVNSIVHTGAKPVLADVHPETWNITAQEIERCITPKTKAVIAVHFGGLPCDIDEIRGLARVRGISVVEDCAHAVGAEYRGKPIGSSEGPCAFSFYANKNMTTAEGGMITTSDDDIAEKVGIWRLHGLDRDAWKRFHRKEAVPSACVYPGFKYNLSDLAASLGIWQLRRLPEMLARREQLAARYDAPVDSWEDVSRHHRPATRSEGRHGLHLYSIVVDPASVTVSRDHLLAALRAENIGAAVQYEPIHRQPFYARLLDRPDEDLPSASHLGAWILNLPLFPEMTGNDADDTLEAVGKLLRYYRR
jgi:dTDP-4-amino-4,6-dideoxygalactose transaminase